MQSCPMANWNIIDMDGDDMYFVLFDFVSNAFSGEAGEAFVWQERVVMFILSVVRSGIYITIEAFDVDAQEYVTVVLKVSFWKFTACREKESD